MAVMESPSAKCRLWKFFTFRILRRSVMMPALASSMKIGSVSFQGQEMISDQGSAPISSIGTSGNASSMSQPSGLG
eukprot:12997238-Heterocapsa_arctica.AAC.1